MSKSRGQAVFQVPPGFEEEWSGSSATATEVVLNVIRLGEVLHARVAALVKGYGLPSATSLIVLEVLRGADEPLLPSVIAARSFLSRPAMSGVLDTLERRGFVVRQIDPGDRRRILAEITADGRAVMSRVLPALHRAEVDWANGLDPSQQHQVLEHIGRLYRHLES